MILSNKVYDVLKWITLILLPALAAFYMALAPVWGLPYPTEISATIAGIDVFLAAVLSISSNTFKVENPLYRLNLVKMVGEIKGAWIMGNQVYDILTWVAQILLPALAALYGLLAQIWGLPMGDQIVSTIVILDTFLGMLLGFSTSEFHKRAAQICVALPKATISN